MERQRPEITWLQSFNAHSAGPDASLSPGLQQDGWYLHAGKVQLLWHPCSCICLNSVPQTSKALACAPDFFFPGLFRDASYLTYGCISAKAEGTSSVSKYTFLLYLPHSTSCLLEASWCLNKPDPNSFLVTPTDNCFHLLWKRLFRTLAIHYQSLLAQGKLLSGPDLTAWKLLKFIGGESCASEVFSACVPQL